MDGELVLLKIKRPRSLLRKMEVRVRLQGLELEQNISTSDSAVLGENEIKRIPSGFVAAHSVQCLFGTKLRLTESRTLLFIIKNCLLRSTVAYVDLIWAGMSNSKKHKKYRKRQKRSRSNMSTPKLKTAIITGANSGVGFGIAQRLLDHSERNPDEPIRIILACRNQERAIRARDTLLTKYPNGDIVVTLVDTSSVRSVFEFCNGIKKKYKKIDLLFCNAGILSCDFIDWSIVARQVFTDQIALLTETQCIVQPVGKLTSEEIGETFATNLFGHYVMIRELVDLLAVSGESKVIWTSSLTCRRSDYDPKDFQGCQSKSPYESSKYAIDIIAIAMNDFLNRRNIKSFTTHPGVVATNIVRSHMPWIMGKVMENLFYVARTVGLSMTTGTGWNGSYANYYVAVTPSDELDASVKYGSFIKPWGTVYVRKDDVDKYDEGEAKSLLQNLNDLFERFQKKKKGIDYNANGH
ncbi:4101_t:CDS:2 [Paraglomus occultum]|uniref:4101_t:CDS:1 n=1 Tax=Paraglomus occultum TaxID=144539 RepID=A0A9N8Z6F9_9GLOM|nr:4101_t:CDS:2 [Paraglomus occultum]